jgi:hypothetical protein
MSSAKILTLTFNPTGHKTEAALEIGKVVEAKNKPFKLFLVLDDKVRFRWGLKDVSIKAEKYRKDHGISHEEFAPYLDCFLTKAKSIGAYDDLRPNDNPLSSHDNWVV